MKPRSPLLVERKIGSTGKQTRLMGERHEMNPLSHTAFIALGSNLGDRRELLRSALRALGRIDGTHVVACSNFHETDPVGGPPGQGRYLNAVARVETAIDPEALLHHLQQIELEHGRERHEPDAPRTLDLDLLTYENRECRTPDLTLPHPRMHQRLFVLEPLCEIAPDHIHPQLRRTFSALRDDLKNSQAI